MESSFEDFIVQRITEKNPLHSKKIRKNLKRMKADPDFENLSKNFYDKYDAYLRRIGKSREHAVDSYLRMIDDFTVETVRFGETGKYSSTSFEEVNARVYARPEVMEYYMHGLLLTQFIWVHHFELQKYYAGELARMEAGKKTYLEIGGGHGLYVNLAQELLKGEWIFTVLDISETSLSIAKNFVQGKSVNFIHADVFTLAETTPADLIVMGEVLEHVEDPKALLVKLKSMLNPEGRLFITTPTNAPAIDHIYLFRNTNEIRTLIADAGLIVTSEMAFGSEDCSVDFADEKGISVLYSAFLRKE